MLSEGGNIYRSSSEGLSETFLRRSTLAKQAAVLSQIKEAESRDREGGRAPLRRDACM
jgi:hypothetical protein